MIQHNISRFKLTRQNRKTFTERKLNKMYNIYDEFERVNESLAEVMEMSPGKLERASQGALAKGKAYSMISHDAGERASDSLMDKDPETGLHRSELRNIRDRASDIASRKYAQSNKLARGAERARARDTIKGLRSGGKRYSLI